MKDINVLLIDRCIIRIYFFWCFVLILYKDLCWWVLFLMCIRMYCLWWFVLKVCGVVLFVGFFFCFEFVQEYNICGILFLILYFFLVIIIDNLGIYCWIVFFLFSICFVYLFVDCRWQNVFCIEFVYFGNCFVLQGYFNVRIGCCKCL